MYKTTQDLTKSNVIDVKHTTKNKIRSHKKHFTFKKMAEKNDLDKTT